MLRKNKPWLALMSSVLALASTSALAQWGLNMPEGITGISRETYSLHMTIFIICVLIGVVVYGVLFFSLIKYRKSKGAVPAKFHHSTKVEVLWTVVPFLILIGMAIPSTRVLTQIYDASESELDIVITGYQWRWQYRYLSEDGEEVSFSATSLPLMNRFTTSPPRARTTCWKSTSRSFSPWVAKSASC